ncbi:6196_t:CDS:2, partial [Racocetra persica]
EFETTSSHHRRQGLYKGSNIDFISSQSELNFNADDVTIDKSKREHKIDSAVGMRLLRQNLIVFLVVEFKKPGVDSGNDKKKQLQEQYDQLDITVYDISGSLLGHCHLLKRSIYMLLKDQLKHHTIDYIELLMAIKMLLKDLKSQFQGVEKTLSKIINNGNKDNNVKISVYNGTI